MRYTQYKGVVEREYKKSLRKIMHELCIVEGLDAAAGADRLGVAKSIFEYWRNFYRFDDKQRLFDEKVKELGNLQFLYMDEEKSKAVKEPLRHDDIDLAGFQEQIKKMEAYYRQIHAESDGLAVEAANLPLFEFASELIQRYRSGELRKEIEGQAVPE